MKFQWLFTYDKKSIGIKNYNEFLRLEFDSFLIAIVTKLCILVLIVDDICNRLVATCWYSEMCIESFLSTLLLYKWLSFNIVKCWNIIYLLCSLCLLVFYLMACYIGVVMGDCFLEKKLLKEGECLFSSSTLFNFFCF